MAPCTRDEGLSNERVPSGLEPARAFLAETLPRSHLKPLFHGGSWDAANLLQLTGTWHNEVLRCPIPQH